MKKIKVKDSYDIDQIGGLSSLDKKVLKFFKHVSVYILVLLAIMAVRSIFTGE